MSNTPDENGPVELNEESSPEPVAELPASCKLVYTVLEQEGVLTSPELAGKTTLADSTVWYALDRLEANGHVTSDVDVRDPRRRVYTIPDDDSP